MKIIADMDFFENLILTCSRHDEHYVLVTESPHWSPTGQRWLAQFAASLLVKYGLSPRILTRDPASWEHSKFEALEIEGALKAINKKRSLLIHSVSHNCPLASRIETSKQFSTYDVTAYSIDPHKVGRAHIESATEKINKLYSLIDDCDSRTKLNSLIFARQSGDLGIIKASDFPIYHHPIFRNFEGLRGDVIDGGAFDGSESFKFAKHLDEQSVVWGYEFDLRNYKDHLLNRSTEKIHFINKGLWSCKEAATIVGSGIGARVSTAANSGINAELISLDEDFAPDRRVAFIKLDIEGAEINALRGARGIINRDLPLLAISVYHQPTDLWEIPLLINELNPEYRFFFGQHARLLSESVLYCYPDR